MATLQIGIAGLGTVGSGVIGLLRRNASLIEAGCGRGIGLAGVSARDRSRDRGLDLGDCRWFDDARDLADDPGIDVVVELIGGEDGVALDLARRAIAAGKHLVTANKALLAIHGTELATAADRVGVHVGYEAAVAGGVPVIKTLREGLAANRVRRVHGILNGTSNYILTAMRQHGAAFDDVLGEAQRLGYAELDPTLDIGGGDAAHKLAILAALAFRRSVDFAGVHVEGIGDLTPMDIVFAREFGYRIKLLAIAQVVDGGIEQRVHPTMVPEDGAIAHIDGVLNAVVIEGDAAPVTTLIGEGAGAGPTATAVVADLADIARGVRHAMFAAPSAGVVRHPLLTIDQRQGEYYVRLMVTDRPGVIADVSAILRDEQISLGSLLQRGRNPGETVPVVMTTHEAEEASMRRACNRIAALHTVTEPPVTIRIERV